MPPFRLLFHCSQPHHMDFDTDFWSEIQDAPGEIFDMDIPELRDEEQFNMNEYLNANYDY